MIHFMASVYANAVERGTKTIEEVPEFDPKTGDPVRKCVVAVLVVRQVKAKTLTFAEACGEEGTVNNGNPYYGVAKDDEELQEMIIEYAASQKVTL